MNARKMLRGAGITLACVLAIIYIGLFLFQDRIIFQSVPLEKNYAFQFDAPFEEHFIPVPNEDRSRDSLNALWFPADSASLGLILYFHGNRGNLQRWGRYAMDLTHYRYDVLVIDYRGYGKSSGKPDEQTMYSDARAVYEWARHHNGIRPIVIYGRSLGSAVASNLATQVDPVLLILETPFDEMRGAIPPYWGPLTSLLPLKYTFSNAENLRLVHSRVVIFHGTNDHIVPLSSALRLKQWTAPNDFVILEGGTHRNLNTFPAYREKLESLLVNPAF